MKTLYYKDSTCTANRPATVELSPLKNIYAIRHLRNNKFLILTCFKHA